MLDLLKTFGDGRCADVHDKVFALRGLAFDAENFKVDYTMTAEEVLLQTISVLSGTSLSVYFRYEEILRNVVQLSQERLQNYLELPYPSGHALDELPVQFRTRSVGDININHSSRKDLGLEMDVLLCDYGEDVFGVQIGSSYKQPIPEMLRSGCYLSMPTIVLREITDGVYRFLFWAPRLRLPSHYVGGELMPIRTWSGLLDSGTLHVTGSQAEMPKLYPRGHGEFVIDRRTFLSLAQAWNALMAGSKRVIGVWPEEDFGRERNDPPSFSNGTSYAWRP